MRYATFGEEMAALLLFVSQWNSWEQRQEVATGKKTRQRKKPPDSLAVVRVPQPDTLVWDTGKALRELLEKEQH